MYLRSVIRLDGGLMSSWLKLSRHYYPQQFSKSFFEIYSVLLASFKNLLKNVPY